LFLAIYTSRRLQPRLKILARDPCLALRFADSGASRIPGVSVRGGVDLGYARRLPRLLAEAGLEDVGAEGFLAFYEGRSAGAMIEQANIMQIRKRLIECGLASSKQISRYFQVLDDPSTRCSLPLPVSACGRNH
jgi:hypothetical protein